MSASKGKDDIGYIAAAMSAAAHAAEVKVLPSVAPASSLSALLRNIAGTAAARNRTARSRPVVFDPRCPRREGCVKRTD